MRRIAILNQKGGVGKTTTSVNLGAALARAGKRVCILDMDPQAHASTHLGIEPDGQSPSMYEVLIDSKPLAEVRRQADDNLWVVGSDINLAAAEVELAGVVGREVILRDLLQADSSPLPCTQGRGVGGEGSAPLAAPPSHSRPLTGGVPGERGETFDFVLMDCAPSLGVLTLNALCAADEVFIPLQPHFLALHGLSKLLETTALVSKRINPHLRVSGVILCMCEANTRLAQEVERDLGAFLENSRGSNVPWSQAHVFNSRIRRNIKLAEAPSFGKSIFGYAPTCHGADDYLALAMEVLGEAMPKVVSAKVKMAAEVPVA
jgi:chromosome partitioning protein